MNLQNARRQGAGHQLYALGDGVVGAAHVQLGRIFAQLQYEALGAGVHHHHIGPGGEAGEVPGVFPGALAARAVGAVVANDLMSDVLLFDADDPLLLTSLASDQAIRTAHIVGAMGVVVHNAKPLSETMIKVAEDLHIPLVSSPLSKYDACVKLHDALEMEKRG
jgi:hypothetical protein